MAAPNLQAQGTIATGVTTGVPTITIPTHQADDILIVHLMAWVPNTTTPDAAQIPTPSTWTLLGVQVGQPAASPRDGWSAVFWKRATGAGTTVTPTRGSGWDTGTDTCYGGRAYVIRGCKNTGDPFETSSNSGPHTAANQSFAAVTVSGTQRLVTHFGIASDNLAFSMASTGWTTGTEENNNGGTDSAAQTARKDNQSASTSADAATVTAPTGFYAFHGVSFLPQITPTKGRVSFAELETPFVKTKARVSWAEFETPLGATRGRVSFAELEAPLAHTKARVSFAELQVPIVPTKARISWAELQVPDLVVGDPTRGLVSWAELQVPLQATLGRVSFAELEVPISATRARISFAELEVPIALTRGLASWMALEVPAVATRGYISWAEFQAPTVGGDFIPVPYHPITDKYIRAWNLMNGPGTPYQ